MMQETVNELADRYIDLSNAEMGLYNADAEMFTLYIPDMMSSLVPVSLKEAIWAKNHGPELKITDPQFSIYDDRFILTSFIASVEDKTYPYNAKSHGVYADNFHGKPQLGNIRKALPQLSLQPGLKQNILSVSTPESGVDMDIPLNNILQQDVFALIIGNDDYSTFNEGKDENINVKYAERDARTFRAYLHKTFGVPQENISLLINATAGQMNQALTKMQALARACGGKAQFIFYYAGHGLPEESSGEPYLVPVDVTGSDLSLAISL